MNMEEVRFISATPNAEALMGYCARVSNPNNQDNPNVAGLLAYCIKKGHWSIFEQASMNVEITTSRGIAPQILRHKSFSFQEFSQRYAVVDEFIVYEARRQSDKNRQSSVDDLPEDDKQWFRDAQKEVWAFANKRYQEALDKGVAKECARFLLPSGAQTRLYMSGTVRSWIHYILLRTKSDVQLEHARIAHKIKYIFCKQFPIVAEAVDWGV